MKILITGGAGFIGVNTASRFIKKGWDVFVIDNLSRKGSEFNLEYLKELGKFKFLKVDIRETEKLFDIFKKYGPFDAVIHLAAQVAVTTSVVDPFTDFEINAFGSLNLLEATRRFSPDASFIFSSTNKVYGSLEKYDYEMLKNGVPEEMPLDFHSPYGCSKGCADQYVRDYSRIYGLKTVVFRQSCIYGPRQFGIEDQGWVAWFIIAGMLGKKIIIYGDGKQIRDLLFVDDLIDLYEITIKNIENVRGEIFNIGGGKQNKLSLLEMIGLLEERLNKKIELEFDKERPGDQKIFVADISKVERKLGWKPKVCISDGVNVFFDWAKKNKNIILEFYK
uniref:SDR family NAD(P)-dependent oxidoreductase n=1 Tax=candidate division WOR-3 bacterium TaxID=2052148 RepID=A0A7C4UA46_UNCW3